MWNTSKVRTSYVLVDAKKRNKSYCFKSKKIIERFKCREMETAYLIIKHFAWQLYSFPDNVKTRDSIKFRLFILIISNLTFLFANSIRINQQNPDTYLEFQIKRKIITHISWSIILFQVLEKVLEDGRILFVQDAISFLEHFMESNFARLQKFLKIICKRNKQR